MRVNTGTDKRLSQVTVISCLGVERWTDGPMGLSERETLNRLVPRPVTREGKNLLFYQIFSEYLFVGGTEEKIKEKKTSNRREHDIGIVTEKSNSK